VKTTNFCTIWCFCQIPEHITILSDLSALDSAQRHFPSVQLKTNQPSKQQANKSLLRKTTFGRSIRRRVVLTPFRHKGRKVHQALRSVATISEQKHNSHKNKHLSIIVLHKAFAVEFVKRGSDKLNAKELLFGRRNGG
jgi:hypothetical protein